jgi:hypothetical protein
LKRKKNFRKTASELDSKTKNIHEFKEKLYFLIFDLVKISMRMEKQNLLRKKF